MNRRHLLGQAAVASALAAMPSYVRAQTAPQRVQIAGTPTEDATNLYYATKNNLFAKAGLDVEMVNTATGGAAVAGVIGGTYDIARTSLMPLLFAHLRDITIVSVFASQLFDSKSPTALLQVAADSTIRTASDLNGKIVGVPSLSELNAVASKAWIDKNGGDWRSVKFVEVPGAALVAALQQHRVDAAIVQSPLVFASIAAGTTKTLGDAWGAIAPRFMVGVYVARTDWVAANGPLLRRLVPIYTQASAYVNSHHAETVQDVADLAHMDLAVIRTMPRTVNPTVLDIALVQPVIDVAARYEIIPHAFPAKDIIATF